MSLIRGGKETAVIFGKKLCKQCGKNKPLSEFSLRKDNKNIVLFVKIVDLKIRAKDT